MKRSGYALVMAAVFTSGIGCSTLSGMTSPGGIASAAQDAAALGQKCEALRSAEVPQSEEMAVGGSIAVNYLKIGQGAYSAGNPDNDITAYLNTVGKNLAAHSSRPGLAWTFGAVESDAINAYSTPGGYVLVTKGLLKRLKSESELAGILAHEIGHVNKKHALQQWKTSKVTACAAGGAASIAASNEAGGVGSLVTNADFFKKALDNTVDALVNAGLSQGAEYEADSEALKLVVLTGYDPKPFIAFIGALPGGGAFKNHPSGSDRAAALNKQLDAMKTDNPFLASVDKPQVVPLKGELSSLK